MRTKSKYSATNASLPVITTRPRRQQQEDVKEFVRPETPENNVQHPIKNELFLTPVSKLRSSQFSRGKITNNSSQLNNSTTLTSSSPPPQDVPNPSPVTTGTPSSVGRRHDLNDSNTSDNNSNNNNNNNNDNRNNKDKVNNIAAGTVNAATNNHSNVNDHNNVTGTNTNGSVKLPSISTLINETSTWPTSAPKYQPPFNNNTRFDPFYPGTSSFGPTPNLGSKMDVSDPIECGTSIHARQSSSRLDVTSPVGYDVKYKKSRLESPATTNHRIQRLEEGDDYLDHSKVSIIQKIPRRSGRSRRGEDPLPEVKSKSKVKIVGTHTFQSVQNKKLRKETPKKDKKIKRWTKEEDDLIIFQKEALKKSWKDIELLLDRKHSWQAIQMRYLRCHKQRNNEWSDFDEQRLLDKISEDYENRFKRLAVELGPSFNSERIYAKINELAKSEGNVPRLIKVYYDTADEDEDDIDDEDKVDEEEDEDDEDDEEEDEEEDDDDEEDGGEEEDDGEEDDEEEEDGDDDDVVVEEEEQEEDNEEDRDDDRNDKAKIKNGQINGREY